MAKIRNFHSFGAVFPHFCLDKCEIWHGGADYSPVPNFTFIGATCRPCRSVLPLRGKKPIFGLLSKNNTGSHRPASNKVKVQNYQQPAVSSCAKSRIRRTCWA